MNVLNLFKNIHLCLLTNYSFKLKTPYFSPAFSRDKIIGIFNKKYMKVTAIFNRKVIRKIYLKIIFQNYYFITVFKFVIICRLTTRPGFARTIPVWSSPSRWQTSTSQGHWSVPFVNTENLCNSKYPFKLQIKFYFLFSKKIEIF